MSLSQEPYQGSYFFPVPNFLFKKIKEQSDSFVRKLLNIKQTLLRTYFIYLPLFLIEKEFMETGKPDTQWQIK